MRWLKILAGIMIFSAVMNGIWFARFSGWLLEGPPKYHTLALYSGVYVLIYAGIVIGCILLLNSQELGRSITIGFLSFYIFWMLLFGILFSNSDIEFHHKGIRWEKLVFAGVVIVALSLTDVEKKTQ